MRKFITKNVLFLSPIFVLNLAVMMFYSTDKGDLLRLGYMIDITANYRNIFRKEFERTNHLTKISDVNLNSMQRYDVLTLGDSFSEQAYYGYNDYLAQNYGVDVLHFDRYLTGNPIRTLHGIINGDLLEKISVDYIILQSVERRFVHRAKSDHNNNILSKESLGLLIKAQKAKMKKHKSTCKLFSDKIFKVLIFNILYLFDDNAFNSLVYKVRTDGHLFSINKNELLFYYQDLENVKDYNDLKSVVKLNEELNNLSKKLRDKGVELIVLPSPDKYDFYYDFICNKNKYPKPLFFDHLGSVKKDYLYVNTKKVLSNAMRYKKDIYFYDDTHWSPWASQIVAKELIEILQKNNKYAVDKKGDL